MTRHNRINSIRRLVLGALPLTGLLACDSPTDVPGGRPPAQAPVAYVEILAPAGELAVGQTVTLGTKLLSAEGAQLNRPVAWTSSDTAVATVSTAGVLTARAEGVALITARSEGVDAMVSVSIRGQAGGITIELDAPAADLIIGQTFAVPARVRGADGAIVDRPLQWSSSNPAVAAVSATGLVSAIGAGTALISAAAEGRQATVLITVRNEPARALALEPAAVRAGSAGFELTIRGTGFQPGATVRWAGQERHVRVISPTEIRMDIAAADVKHTGAAEVRVLNPDQAMASAPLFFIIEQEPVTHTWDLQGLATGGALPVEIGGFFQNGDVSRYVEQRVTRGVLQIHEPGYGPSRWELRVRIVTTLRATGEVVKDEDLLFFGTVEYVGLEGYMRLRSDLFTNVVLRTIPAPDGGLIVSQTLHHTGDAQYEQAWRYNLRR